LTDRTQSYYLSCNACSAWQQAESPSHASRQRERVNVSKTKNAAIVSKISTCVRILIEGFSRQQLPLAFRLGQLADCNVYQPDGERVVRRTTMLGNISKETVDGEAMDIIQDALSGQRTVYLLGASESREVEEENYVASGKAMHRQSKEDRAEMTKHAIKLGVRLPQGVYLYRGAYIYLAHALARVTQGDMWALARVKKGKTYYVFAEGEEALPILSDLQERERDDDHVEVIVEDEDYVEVDVEDEDDIVVAETS
jgi:hypothetical protein